MNIHPILSYSVKYLIIIFIHALPLWGAARFSLPLRVGYSLVSPLFALGHFYANHVWALERVVTSTFYEVAICDRIKE